MSTRVNVTVINNSGLTVKCTNTSCESFTNLSVGDTIAAGGKNTFSTDTNNRIFATFAEESPGIGAWQLAMTCPELSDNSACGSFNAGLQTYEEDGTPANFTFILGTPNKADWDSGSSNNGDVISYGDCS